jgi:neurotransmitter:Na+ symporter, NSS family
MIPYFCALSCLGIPDRLGRVDDGEATAAERASTPLRHPRRDRQGRPPATSGVTGVLIPLAVSFYYTFIEAWCLGYFWHYLTGGIGVDASAPVAEQTAAASTFFNGFVGNDANGLLFGGSYETLVFWIITFAINIWLVFRGLSKGIEKFVPLGDAAHGHLRGHRPDPRAHPRHARPVDPDQNVINGLGYMWNPTSRALATRRPGWPRRGRSSSASRSGSASSSTTRPTCGKRTTWSSRA